MAKPMSKPVVVAPGQEPSITVTLRSVRNPPLDIKLTSQLPMTSVHQIKSVVAEKTGIASAKIKLLHKKKPVADSKALKDLVEESGPPQVEFSVMVIGVGAVAGAGAGAGVAGQEPAATSAEAGPGSETAAKEDEPTVIGAAALDTAEFWTDLKSFLMLRLKDEATAERATALFQEAWKTKS